MKYWRGAGKLFKHVTTIGVAAYAYTIGGLVFTFTGSIVIALLAAFFLISFFWHTMAVIDTKIEMEKNISILAAKKEILKEREAWEPAKSMIKDVLLDTIVIRTIDDLSHRNWYRGYLNYISIQRHKI